MSPSTVLSVIWYSLFGSFLTLFTIKQLLPNYKTCLSCSLCFGSRMRSSTVCPWLYWFLLLLLYQYCRSMVFSSRCPDIRMSCSLTSMAWLDSGQSSNGEQHKLSFLSSDMSTRATVRNAILSRVRMVLLAHHVNVPCRLRFISRRNNV